MSQPGAAGEAFPERRTGPPWVMSDMILAERTLPRPILAQPAAGRLANAVAETLGRGEPVVVTGCGTSEHAARAVAALLARALEQPGVGALSARQAFEASLAPARGGLCIAISHEGESGATLAALEAARGAGATTALITAAPDSEAAARAELVYPTPLRDASWCHTVGYLSPVLAGAATAAALRGRPLLPDAVAAFIGACDEALAPLETLAATLASHDRLLVVGSGLDAISAAEQALKIEEGAWTPAEWLELETLLHGHLPAADAGTGVVAFLLDPHARPQRAARSADALRALAELGLGVLLISDAAKPPASGDGEVTLVALPSAGFDGSLAALLAGALALQRLTLALALQRGTNPDLLRRDDARYRAAARAASARPSPQNPAP
jgi:fructoselysine-6-P-deglycase FrlB-like protein